VNGKKGTRFEYGTLAIRNERTGPGRKKGGEGTVGEKRRKRAGQGKKKKSDGPLGELISLNNKLKEGNSCGKKGREVRVVKRQGRRGQEVRESATPKKSKRKARLSLEGFSQQKRSVQQRERGFA